MMEEGSRIPRLPMLEQLAEALQLSPAWLAFGMRQDREPFVGLRCASLSSRIKEVRTLRGLTLREVGRRATSSAAAVRAVEGGSMPTLDTVEELAQALGVSESWLAFGIGPMVTRVRRAGLGRSTAESSAR